MYTKCYRVYTERIQAVSCTLGRIVRRLRRYLQTGTGPAALKLSGVFCLLREGTGSSRVGFLRNWSASPEWNPRFHSRRYRVGKLSSGDGTRGELGTWMGGVLHARRSLEKSGKSLETGGAFSAACTTRKPPALETLVPQGEQFPLLTEMATETPKICRPSTY